MKRNSDVDFSSKVNSISTPRDLMEWKVLASGYPPSFSFRKSGSGKAKTQAKYSLEKNGNEGKYQRRELIYSLPQKYLMSDISSNPSSPLR